MGRGEIRCKAGSEISEEPGSDSGPREKGFDLSSEKRISLPCKLPVPAANLSMNESDAPLELPRLYAILDPSQLKGISELEAARRLSEAGVKLIQYRDKHASSRRLCMTALKLAEIVSGVEGDLIVNDRPDIAFLAGASGVHVGQEDIPLESVRSILGEDAVIGLSTHTLEQVREGEQTSADYLAFGPIFATQSKDHPDVVVGLEGLRMAREATTKPLVAIGGITLETAPQVLAAGADSVAVIRDLIGVEDIGERAGRYLQTLESVG